MENSNKKVTVSFETTEADYLSSLSPYKDISLSGPVDIFATADILGSSDSKPTYDEYKEYFSKEEIYSLVSNRILNTGENARTIKNKIQAVIEDQLFEKFLKNGEDQSIVTEEGA